MAGIEQGVGFPITAVDQFSGAFDKLKARVTGASEGFARLNGAIAMMTGGLGVGAFAAFMKHTIDAHEEVNKFSQKLGIAVGELSALKYAANQSDVGMESLTKGIKGLSQKMTEAVDATSKAGRLLKALGVDAEGGTGPAIEKIATAFTKLPDGATKAALAVELFGKAGMDMIPFLNQGAEGIRRMKEEAIRLGIVMDEQTAKAAEQFNDNLKTIKATSERLGVSLLNEMAPALVRITNAMKEAAIEGGILKAVWVGLGGALAEALGLNADPAIKRMREINKEILDLQAKIAAGPTDLGSGVQDKAYINQYIARVKVLQAELRAAQVLQDAISGKYDDQASRSGRQGARLGGVQPGYEEQVRGLLGIKDGAEKGAKAMKDLALANEHVNAYLKDLAEQEKIQIQLQEHLNKLTREAQQEEVDSINARDAVLDRLEDGNAALRVETETLGMTSAAREIYILRLEMERDVKMALGPEDEARIRTLYAEREALIATAQSRRDSLGMWDDLSNRVAAVATGISSWTDELRRFGKELVALLAKKWFLQIVAGVTGSSSIGAMAGQVGQGTLSGMAGTALSSFGGSVVAGWQGASLGAGLAGPTTAGASLLTGQGIGAALAAIPGWGWALLAAAAVAAVISQRAGGPKEGGSYFGSYDSSGRLVGNPSVPGTDNGRFFTPTGGDPAMRQFGDTIAQGFFSTLRRLGGSSSGIDFGFGYDQDPQGRAASRVSAMVRSSSGSVLYSGTSGAGRDDADFQRALALESKRALLAALQASDLPDAIAAILAPMDAMAASADQIDAALAAAQLMADVITALAELNMPGIDIDALQGFQRAGETIDATLTRVATAYSRYADLFLTDAEKLGLAQSTVTSTFARLGIAVPDSMQGFKDLVNGLDLTTASGRATWEALMEVAPAFATVANAATQAAAAAAAAASAMLASFDSVMGQLRGSPYTRTVIQQQLDTALGQFSSRGSGNNWAMGMSNDALLGQILTITREDFRNYGADMQKLITQILTLYQSLSSLSDPIETVTTALGPALEPLAPIIDTAAIAAAHLTSKLDLLSQIYALNGDAASAAAIKAHQRAIALDEIRRQDLAAGTIGELEGLTTTLWALQDAAAAAAELDRQHEEAARGVIATMQELVRSMDQVAAFRDSIGGNIQSIRSGMSGFDAIGYQTGQVGAARISLASATDLQERLAAAGRLRDAIMGRYSAEMNAANELHQQQESAAKAAIDAANQLNQAFRAIGDYAKSLLVGDLSTLSPEQKLSEARNQYQDLLAKARGGDVAAAGALQGAASTYLGQARDFYASSGSYVRIFDEVQGALSVLGASAGADQVYQENTAAWQASLLEIQTRAIGELTGLQELTDAWQQDLQDQLVEQGIHFASIDLTNEQIVENTKDLDKRIGKIITDALAAVASANETVVNAQTSVISSIPGGVALAVGATARR